MNGLDDPPHDGSSSLHLDASMLGLLAYLFGIVSGVLLLVLEKEHGEVRFHAAQSVVFSIAVIVASIMGSALLFIPVLGVLVSSMVALGSVALWVYLLVQGFRLNHVELPVLGPYAVRLAARA